MALHGPCGVLHLPMVSSVETSLRDTGAIWGSCSHVSLSLCWSGDEHLSRCPYVISVLSYWVQFGVVLCRSSYDDKSYLKVLGPTAPCFSHHLCGHLAPKQLGKRENAPCLSVSEPFQFSEECLRRKKKIINCSILSFSLISRCDWLKPRSQCLIFLLNL